MCDPESITSLVKKHIPDARLTTQSEERLMYILPLESTNKFPGNSEQAASISVLQFSHLHKGNGSHTFMGLFWWLNYHAEHLNILLNIYNT